MIVGLTGQAAKSHRNPAAPLWFEFLFAKIAQTWLALGQSLMGSYSLLKFVPLVLTVIAAKIPPAVMFVTEFTICHAVIYHCQLYFFRQK